MTTPIQVALPLAVLTLIAGGSLVAWVVLFRRAAKDEAADPHVADASHSGA
ncbi:MAG: hypothetical protein ACYDC5_05680 [Candidatus Dormibacteria bacterium]